MIKTETAERKRVYIPSRPDHGGFHGVFVELDWVCPTCGGPRGEVFDIRSYDGSQVLGCHGWRNPCGHVDKYSAVLAEANGDSDVSN